MIKKNLFLVMFTMILLLPVSVFAEETCSYNVKGWYLANRYTENTGNGIYSADTISVSVDNNNIKLASSPSNQSDYGINIFGESLLNWNKDKDGFSSISGSCPNYIFIYTGGVGYDWYGSNNLDDYKKRDYKDVFIFQKNDKNNDTYTCQYPDFTLYVNTKSKTLKAQGKMEYVGDHHQESRTQYVFSDEFIEWYFSTNTTNECLNFKMYNCENGDTTILSVNPVKRVYTDEYLASVGEDKNLRNCEVETATGTDEDVVDPKCYSYETKLGELEVKFINYDTDCDSNCKRKSIASIQKEYKEIKSFCRVLTSNLNVGNICVDSCLTLEDSLMDFSEKYNVDINLNSVNGECGFSENLIGFILNIIKWIKYIIPAIVIILSIIDFIKAIASDKDDEMKKAQDKFIKRLIAAALIFIVPLILEFVLDKMGFAEHIKGCGIIEF